MWGSADQVLPVIAEHSSFAEQPDHASLGSAAKPLNTLPPGYKAGGFSLASVPEAEAPLADKVRATSTDS